MFPLCSLSSIDHRCAAKAMALMPGKPGSLFERLKPELAERTDRPCRQDQKPGVRSAGVVEGAKNHPTVAASAGNQQ
jgi:hypothetical protein